MTNGKVFDRRAYYKIRVMGLLDGSWSDWFDGFTIQFSGDETLLSGYVEDQASLFGILNKLNHLGMTLITLDREDEGKEDVEG